MARAAAMRPRMPTRPSHAMPGMPLHASCPAYPMPAQLQQIPVPGLPEAWANPHLRRLASSSPHFLCCASRLCFSLATAVLSASTSACMAVGTHAGSAGQAHRGIQRQWALVGSMIF